MRKKHLSLFICTMLLLSAPNANMVLGAATTTALVTAQASESLQNEATPINEVITVQKSGTVSMKQIFSTLKKVYKDNYRPNYSIDAATLEEVYGISPKWYKSFRAEQDMISVNVDRIIVVKAKKKYKKQVLNALTGYRQSVIDESFTYPINIGKINAAKVVQYGNYFFYFILGGELGLPTKNDTTEQAMIKRASDANQLAINALDKLFKK